MASVRIGKTEVSLGSRVKITRIANGDLHQQELVGATGRLQCLCHGLISKNCPKPVAGVALDPEFHANFGSCQNLMAEDEVEVL